MNVIWTAEAKWDLSWLRIYISGHNKLAAKNEARLIARAITQLTQFPESGRPGRCANTRKMIAGKTPYIIAYRIKRDSIQILRIIHPKRQWPEEM